MKTIIKVILRSFIITVFIFIVCHILNINHIIGTDTNIINTGLFGYKYDLTTSVVEYENNTTDNILPGGCVERRKENPHNIGLYLIIFLIVMLLCCFTQYLYIRKHSIRKMIFIHSVLVLTIIYLLYLYFTTKDRNNIKIKSHNYPSNNLIVILLFIIISILLYDIHRLYVKYKQKHQMKVRQKHQMKVRQKEQKQYPTISLLNDELTINILEFCFISLCYSIAIPVFLMIFINRSAYVYADMMFVKPIPYILLYIMIGVLVSVIQLIIQTYKVHSDNTQTHVLQLRNLLIYDVIANLLIYGILRILNIGINVEITNPIVSFINTYIFNMSWITMLISAIIWYLCMLCLFLKINKQIK